jgi:hypothetical protein
MNTELGGSMEPQNKKAGTSKYPKKLKKTAIKVSRLNILTNVEWSTPMQQDEEADFTQKNAKDNKKEPTITPEK